MTKAALEAFDPFILLVIQLTFSVTALWTAVILFSSPMLGLRPMARAGSTGVLEPGLAYAVGVPGLAMTTAGNASVIAALEPVFIFLGAWVLFRTRPSAVAFAAIVVAVIGVTLVSLTDPAALGGGSVLGDGLVLLGTAFAAAYVLASSRLAVTMPAILLTALQQSVGLGLVLIFTGLALAAGWQSLPASVSLSMLSLALLSGLIQYALAFWLYIVGLKGIPPGLAGMFLTTTPIFGVFGGMAFLGERLVMSQILGMTLVLLALFALLRSGKG
jgi:drug/metabolite transporter (DMT)-like permease